MDDWEMLVLGGHLAATAGMLGLIWFVQVVHYPLFHQVGAAEFASYERLHQRLTSRVVGPLMAVEGVLALAVAARPPGGVGVQLPVLGLAALAVIHTSTVSLQVPAHRRLTDGKDDATVHRLVVTNWIRTAGWTVRAALALAMVMLASP